MVETSHSQGTMVRISTVSPDDDGIVCIVLLCRTSLFIHSLYLVIIVVLVACIMYVYVSNN